MEIRLRLQKKTREPALTTLTQTLQEGKKKGGRYRLLFVNVIII